MRRVLTLSMVTLSVAAASLLPAGGLRAQSGADATPPESRPAVIALPRDAEAAQVLPAIQRGLGYLRGAQLDSGAIGSRYPVAVTSLAGLAILGAGHGYRHGPYAGTLERALSFLENSARPDGYISDPKSRMHGHCYAVLFLTQLYGELPAVKQAGVAALIQSGLRVIQKSQTRQGGWYYTPENPERQDEASITICALQALRAANSSGFTVPRSTAGAAADYVRKCQNLDGSFRYSLSGQDQHSSYALTVAAVATLHAAGVYDDPQVNLGLEYARRCMADLEDPIRAAEKDFFSYANLYAAQAFYQAGGSLWTTWYVSARKYLLRRQEKGGRFDDDYGAEFGTACALLILEVPLNYLPIFQR